MPRLLFLALVFVLGCNDSASNEAETGPCAESIVLGNWRNPYNGASLGFRADCSGVATYCESAFTYPNVKATSGQVTISTQSTNGKSGCLPIGDSVCTYIVGSSLDVSCNGTSITYSRY